MPKKKNTAAVALGRVRTPSKRRAARANGKLGGRKAKFSVGDATQVNDHAPGDYARRVGIVTEIGPGKSEYRVEFEDSQRPTTGYLMSWWLDKV